MEMSIVVVRQVLIILVLMLIGAIAYKKGMISNKAADDMAAFALKVVTPCVIIGAFQMDYDPRKLFNMGIAAVLAVLTHVVGIALSHLFFGGKSGQNGIRRFAAIYCNCGFMGIPLIQGAVGSEGVLYSSVYIVVFQAIMWSHGVVTVAGGMNKIKPYKIFVNAGTIGIAIGLPLFFLSAQLPPVISESVQHVANLNTPLAMIISGVFVARSEIKKAFTRPKNYLCVALRQLIIPFVMMIVILLIRPEHTVAVTLLIISACPTASAAPLFASLYGSEKDIECASRVLTLSNILSVVTIPAVILLYGAISSLIG